ncbi:MAG: YihY family inner membrane protein [Gallionella sp.]
MQKNWRNLFVFIRAVLARFGHDRCVQIAASLTFTTLLSMVPLITIALTLFSAFPVFDDYSTQIKIYLLENLMPETAGTVITHYMQQFAESAGRLSAVGVAFLAVTAMMMMLTIDKAFNTIWRVSKPRPMFKRLFVYWAVLTLAPVLMGASLSLSSWLIGLSMGYVKQVPFLGVEVLKVLPVFFATMTFALLFRLVPNRYVPLLHAVIGGFVAAVLFEMMNHVFGYYISHFPTYKLVYGAFASVPIFLMWIYFSWMTILLGAVVAASLSSWRTLESYRSPVAEKMLNALRVLKIMSASMRKGTVMTIPLLSKALNLGFFSVEQILDHLANANLVCKMEGAGWLMTREARYVRTTELLRLFVFDRSVLVAGQEDEPLMFWLESCAAQWEENTEVSLQTLFEAPPVVEKRCAAVS